MMVIVIALVIIVIGLIVTGIRIVPQKHEFVMERLGKYNKTLEAGLHIVIPFIDLRRVDVDLREQVADFPPQPVITKDNVTMQIDTVVYYKIVDSNMYAYGVEHPIRAIENLTATTLRNIIGDLELDETLTSRDTVNAKLCETIDEATDPWGIKINRVELKNIMPPRAIQESMEKQMKAERERREQILIAEGEKKSAILRAEGEKESAVLQAEAQYVQITKEAEAHAESIRLHKEAEVNALKMFEEAGFTTEQLVKMKSLDTFEVVSNGNATKIIIPSDIQSVAGFVEGVKESVTSQDISKVATKPKCNVLDEKIEIEENEE